MFSLILAKTVSSAPSLPSVSSLRSCPSRISRWEVAGKIVCQELRCRNESLSIIRCRVKRICVIIGVADNDSDEFAHGENVSREKVLGNCSACVYKREDDDIQMQRGPMGGTWLGIACQTWTKRADLWRSATKGKWAQVVANLPSYKDPKWRRLPDDISFICSRS